MSRNQRIALVVVALAVAVVAFLIAQPGADDEPDRTAATTSAPTDTGDDSAEPRPTEEAEPPPPPKPKVTRISIAGGQVQGGPKTIEVTRGDTVRIVVRADAPDEIHLHGYEITRDVGPGRPARFSFEADAEGAFEMESHVAEDAGRDPLVARLVVQPA